VPADCRLNAMSCESARLPKSQWLVSCFACIPAARPIDSNSAGVSTQSRIVPRWIMLMAKFTCVAVPIAGTTSTFTTSPRSVMVKIRGRVPMKVARDWFFADELFRRCRFEPSI